MTDTHRFLDPEHIWYPALFKSLQHRCLCVSTQKAKPTISTLETREDDWLNNNSSNNNIKNQIPIKIAADSLVLWGKQNYFQTVQRPLKAFDGTTALK